MRRYISLPTADVKATLIERKLQRLIKRRYEDRNLYEQTINAIDLILDTTLEELNRSKGA